jgi:chromobox protein 1
MKRGKSKQSLREAASSEDLPASKRQKRNGAKGVKEAEQDFSWLPKGDQWEDQVVKVETIERNEDTKQLMAYILFTNGKRSKISMDMVYKYCPRPMLRFYEEHLKFK